jgi:shikimate kinase
MDSCSLPLSRTTIVLVGLMGAGKTSVGRRLAARLGLTFVDADTEIEAAAGTSIAAIFEVHGETYFRDGERRVISRLLNHSGQVLATGGGAFMIPETRRLIKERAISVWLRAELDVLLERVMRRDNRPLLKESEPREILATLMKERYPVYAEADIAVDSVDVPHEVMVERVVRALEAYLDQVGEVPA